MKPSEFYKIKRPEYFSDSEIINKVLLPREVLGFELSKISTSQKQDEFETLCRRLAEKFITPNLIPQVGPTGGGDGKTDFETYPVSRSIADRWFVPENGWSHDEKWAFAISAKEAWKGKAKGDVAKIVGTEREYTRVYFMSNQLISSKKKKDAQDEFEKEFNIEVVILDGEWILEKIYNNNLTDIAVDSLNLSNVYNSKEKILGSNDTYRLKELKRLEDNISNPNRYFEYDFQLVEDALETATLSRMLEKPRDEVEGKFERAFRFCEKVDSPKQWIRIYYQRAWTYLNWYDDYALFIKDYKNLKKYVIKNPEVSDVELYFNLFNLLNALSANPDYNLIDYKVDIEKERVGIINILTVLEQNKKNPNSALIAKTYKTFVKFIYCIHQEESPDNYFKELSEIILQSNQSLDYPFESIRKIIEELGNIFPNNMEYDYLVDNLAEVSEKRNSELSSGEIFLRRGGQKLLAEYHKESIVYFGKAVMKLAKVESQDSMVLVLLGLGLSYRELGLIWASNNCYISACSISFKSMSESGILNNRTYQCLEEIIKNELFIGRLPLLFSWFEMLSILNRARLPDKDEENIPFVVLTDGCLSTRILHTDEKYIEELQYLPDMLDKLELYTSHYTTLYRLGYIENVLNDYSDIDNEKDLDVFFDKVASQPFVDQILHETLFLSEENLNLSTKILGCKFLIKFSKDKEILLVTETLLALLEGFFATSITDVIPHTEIIKITIERNKKHSALNYEYYESTSEYTVTINNLDITNENKSEIWESILKFVIDILIRNFAAKDLKQHVTHLFEREEIHERLSLVMEHRNFVFNLLGNTSKVFFDDWLSYLTPQKYVSQRESQLSYNRNINKQSDKNNIDNVRHDEIDAHSIIDLSLWDKAKWKGFGFLFHPQDGLGIILAFENHNVGKRIFEKWISKFGNTDKLESIKISIIKGVDTNNPNWYRVHVSANIDVKDLTNSSNKIISVASRIHEMNANTPDNLKGLIFLFNKYGKYRLHPAKISNDGETIEPCFDKWIFKSELTIKDAWEIGKNDLDRVVIKKNDNPIIPKDIKNAPVLEIIE